MKIGKNYYLTHIDESCHVCLFDSMHFTNLMSIFFPFLEKLAVVSDFSAEMWHTDN